WGRPARGRRESYPLKCSTPPPALDDREDLETKINRYRYPPPHPLNHGLARSAIRRHRSSAVVARHACPCRLCRCRGTACTGTGTARSGSGSSHPCAARFGRPRRLARRAPCAGTYGTAALAAGASGGCVASAQADTTRATGVPKEQDEEPCYILPRTAPQRAPLVRYFG